MPPHGWSQITDGFGWSPLTASVCVSVPGIKRLMVVVEMARQEAARNGSTKVNVDAMFNCAQAVGVI